MYLHPIYLETEEKHHIQLKNKIKIIARYNANI